LKKEIEKKNMSLENEKKKSKLRPEWPITFKPFKLGLNSVL
jgi:hypothetical protein